MPWHRGLACGTDSRKKNKGEGIQREKERTVIRGGDRKLDQKRAEKAGEIGSQPADRGKGRHPILPSTGGPDALT